MEEVKKKGNNPWKGLQSYQENDVIYGRDEEIKALYTRIVYNTQTVVYGKSGIGKSSIINAGIIPRAKHDDMLPVSIRLAHTTKKEQTETASYVEQIFQRIQEEVEKAGVELEEVVPHTVDHKETLWELLHRYRIWGGKGEQRKRIIPLLLLDQFEEIFTLEINARRVDEFFSELADLLNDIKPAYLTPIETEDVHQEQVTQENEEASKSRNVFSKIANRKRVDAPEYIEKSEFHLVITLREDFLSYLERYTAYIPVMKQNRFPLLPLNEEQAAKIITEPIKDLIQPDVALLIIQRVTGREDFKLDGIAEIEVDAALLSLYMEQLYERKDEADQEITSELVVQSDDIIMKFYLDAIDGIPEETIYCIEDELITNAYRRNNVARIDLISEGVPEADIDKLIDRKVLRQFSYNGDLRIEFIHDILCHIVKDRIDKREHLKNENKLKRWLRVGSLLMVIIVLFSAILIASLSYRINSGKMRVSFRIMEDSIVATDGGLWQANLCVISDIKGYKIDTLRNFAEIKRSNRDSIYDLTIEEKTNSIHCILTFSNDEYQKIDTIIMGKSLKVNPNVIIPIHKKESAIYQYSGKVIARVEGHELPLQNAIVIMRDVVQRTNQDGIFTFVFDKPVIESKESVIIIKDGFDFYSVAVPPDQMPTFDLKASQNFRARFEELAVMADSLTNEEKITKKAWNYRIHNEDEAPAIVRFKNQGIEDTLYFYANIANSEFWQKSSINGRDSLIDGNGKYPIKGYYYYGRDTLGNNWLSYHFFSGWVDASDLNSGTPKLFKVESYDVVNNKQRIDGSMILYKEKRIKYSGTIYNNFDVQIGEF